MRLIIEIEMDNAAFEDAPASEAARILLKLSRQIANGAGAFERVKLRDSYGNTVGFAEVVED